MTTVHGVRPPDLSDLALREAVTELLEPYRDALSDASLLLVPDAHYPYQPSTGLVTNPDVVRAVVERLIDVAGRSSVRLAIPPTERGECLPGRGLWYGSIASEEGIDLVDLERSPASEITVHLAETSVAVEIPEPLVSDAVVAVPTIRRSKALVLESAMVSLARARSDSPDGLDARLAVHACDPVVTVLDGTYVFAGEARSPRILFSAADPVALSHVACDLLGLDSGDVPHLNSHLGATRTPAAVDGLSMEELAGTVRGSAPPNPETDDLMARCYRLYAGLTGDLVPPQLLGGGAGD